MIPLRLRGHHLLCLLGYRGMGYSEAFTATMSAVYETLRTEPTTPVILVEGPDDICAAFPEDGPYHCLEERVRVRDERVRKRLGLAVGSQVPWEEILSRIAVRVRPDDIPRWCRTCPWEPLGLCAQGVARVREGGGLSPLPKA